MEFSSLHSGNVLQSGKYKIVNVIAQGGFGITYLAEQVSLGRKVAIKEFFMKEYCNREECNSQVSVGSKGSQELVDRFRTKFIKEAQTIASFSKCPQIVDIIDVFEENGTAYYVMEYISGGSLSDLVKKSGPLSAELALKYTHQVAAALDYIHSRNTMHLDVKPSNILLDEEGNAVLVDFGISKHYDGGGSQTSSSPVGISKGYAPLEQYQQSEISKFSPATDIYSLGATLFTLLTGETPPSASDINEDGLPALPSSIPSALVSAITSAMQPRRKERPQSVSEFLRILDGQSVDTDDEETVILNGKQEKPEEQKNKPNSSSGRNVKIIASVAAFVVLAFLCAVFIPNIIHRESPADIVADDTLAAAQTPEQTKDDAIVQRQNAEPPKTQTSDSSSEISFVELKSISLSKTTLELEMDQSATLSAKYAPSDATDKSTLWKSTNPQIVKVDNSGKVTAIKAGSATISATCQGKTAKCDVHVIEKNAIEELETIPLKSIALNKTTLSLNEGKNEQLRVSYNPSDASDRNTKWKSSNTEVAAVSSSGYVSAVGAGTATITASCQGLTAECVVTVNKPVQAIESSTVQSYVGYKTQTSDSDYFVVSGKILDDKGSPIVGASVLLKGTTRGVFTDLHGHYSIKAKKGDILIAYFIGYKEAVATVRSKSNIDFRLKKGR